MKSQKKLLSLIALSGLLVMSGCIKMNVAQTISTDGNAHMNVVYDMTGMVESMQSMSDGENADTVSIITPEDAQASCDQFLEETTWANPTCTIEGYIFTMGGDVQLTEPALTTSTGFGSTKYNYDLKNLYEQLNAVGSSQGQDFSDTALQEQKQYVEFTGIELTYDLTMPGTITTADVGTISEDGSTVSINLFDMADVESAHVISEVANVPWLWIGIGGAVLVLLIVMGGVVMKKKKPAKTTA